MTFEAVTFEAVTFEAVTFEAVTFEAVTFEAVTFEAVTFEAVTFEAVAVRSRHTHAPPDDRGQFSRLRPAAVEARLAVVATLSKGYDLDYIWKQVDRSRVVNAAGYYIRASETGAEPPGRWWGPGARALGFEPGQVVEREPYDLLFGERRGP